MNQALKGTVPSVGSLVHKVSGEVRSFFLHSFEIGYFMFLASLSWLQLRAEMAVGSKN